MNQGSKVNKPPRTIQVWFMNFTLIILILSMSAYPLFDFSKDAPIERWRVVNDGVMGGLSTSRFTLSPEGHARFSGTVSLENNGGFASVRYRFEKIDVRNFNKVVIKLKGDGKAYQFRIKDITGHRYSYIGPFTTSGEWETIEIPLKTMYPAFRGRKLDMPNFSESTIEEVAFLIGNKKNEDFKLLIDKIELK